MIFYSLHAIHIHLILEERTFTIVSAGNLCATVDHSLTTATCLSSNQASNIVNLPSVVPVPTGHASLSLTHLTACLGIATVGYCSLFGTFRFVKHLCSSVAYLGLFLIGYDCLINRTSYTERPFGPFSKAIVVRYQVSLLQYGSI